MLETIIKILTKYGYMFAIGLGNTLWMALVSIVFGTIIGSFIAIGKLSRKKLLNVLTSIYIEVLRGTPMLLQLYLFWILLPKILPVTDLQCIIVALVINSSAYVAECIRAGIQAVDKGQKEAALSLGISENNIMRKIIFPQAIKNILPALGNEFIVMIKETSLASVFFCGELMTQYKTIQSLTFKAIEPLLIVGIIYLFLTLVLSKLLQIFERRLKESD